LAADQSLGSMFPGLADLKNSQAFWPTL